MYSEYKKEYITKNGIECFYDLRNHYYFNRNLKRVILSLIIFTALIYFFVINIRFFTGIFIAPYNPYEPAEFISLTASFIAAILIPKYLLTKPKLEFMDALRTFKIINK